MAWVWVWLLSNLPVLLAVCTQSRFFCFSLKNSTYDRICTTAAVCTSMIVLSVFLLKKIISLLQCCLSVWCVCVYTKQKVFKKKMTELLLYYDMMYVMIMVRRYLHRKTNARARVYTVVVFVTCFAEVLNAGSKHRRCKLLAVRCLLCNACRWAVRFVFCVVFLLFQSVCTWVLLLLLLLCVRAFPGSVVCRRTVVVGGRA